MRGGLSIRTPLNAHRHTTSDLARFVCVGCRKSLRTTNLSSYGWRRGFVSLATRGLALDSYGVRCRDRPTGPVKDVRYSRRRYNSSKSVAAVEHDASSSTPDPTEVGLPSFRQRLKKWSAEREISIANEQDGEPTGLGSQVATTSAIPQIPAINSLGRGDGPSEATDETDETSGPYDSEYGPDAEGQYQLEAEIIDTLRPGDLVATLVPKSHTVEDGLCVMMRSTGFEQQLVTPKGYWLRGGRIILTGGHVIRQFVSPDEIASIMPHLPDASNPRSYFPEVGPLPIETVSPIIKKIALMEEDIKTFRREHVDNFARFYDCLADEEELVEWAAEDYVPKVFGMPLADLSGAGHLAIERFTSDGTEGLYMGRGLGIAVWVRPRQRIRTERMVIDWVRSYQESAAAAAVGTDVTAAIQDNPLTSFIAKAHRVIRNSRKIRSPTTVGLLGPCSDSHGLNSPSKVPIGESFTENDKAIIQLVLEGHLMAPRLMPSNAASTSLLICSAVGAYPNISMGTRTRSLFLQELGVLAPWDSQFFGRPLLKLPGLGIWPHMDRLEAKAEASCEKASELKDLMCHARKNWGQLPVYCIDSTTTTVIDDGVSVERDEKRPDSVWIHVHIANPAAYLSQDHPIAIFARHRIESAYLPSRNAHMIPVKFAQNVAGIAADRPVMTISSQVQADGRVTNIDITFGVVHNVVTLSQTQVMAAFDTITKMDASMVVGGDASMAENTETTEDHTQSFQKYFPDLSLLYEFLQRRRTKRRDAWPTEERYRAPAPLFKHISSTDFRHEGIPHALDQITHWKGDPRIEVMAERFPRQATDDDFGLVEQAMVLAGESGAKWCRDRGIPLLFKVSVPHADFPIWKLNELKEGEDNFRPKGLHSTIAAPHWSLEIRQYAHLTSPLRRYVDLVNQWQIQAYVNATTNSVPAVQQERRSIGLSAKMPFDQQQLGALATSLNLRHQLTARYIRDENKAHWTIQALFRAFHFNEADLPEVWDLRMMLRPMKKELSVGQRSWHGGLLIPFGVSAAILDHGDGREESITVGQCLPVKIEVVDPHLNLVFVRAVGPPSASPTQTNPIHIVPRRRSS